MSTPVCSFPFIFQLAGAANYTDSEYSFSINFLDGFLSSNEVIQTQWYLDGLILTGEAGLIVNGKTTCGSHIIGVRILTKSGWTGIRSIAFETCKISLGYQIVGPSSLVEGESGLSYKMYRIAISAEDINNSPQLYFPSEEIIIYSIDDNYHFSKGYSQFMFSDPILPVDNKLFYSKSLI